MFEPQGFKLPKSLAVFCQPFVLINNSFKPSVVVWVNDNKVLSRINKAINKLRRRNCTCCKVGGNGVEDCNEVRVKFDAIARFCFGKCWSSALDSISVMTCSSKRSIIVK